MFYEKCIVLDTEKQGLTLSGVLTSDEYESIKNIFPTSYYL